MQGDADWKDVATYANTSPLALPIQKFKEGMEAYRC